MAEIAKCIISVSAFVFIDHGAFSASMNIHRMQASEKKWCHEK